jgi:ribosomal protein S18 acetylase RimI-like enzyme
MTGRAAQPVIVRPAHTDDYLRLSTVFGEAERFHRVALPGVFRQPSGFFPPPALFGQLLDGQDSAVFVAEDGPELVGVVTVRAEAARENEIMVPRLSAIVEMLAVRSDRRRRGIGAALMLAARSWATARGLERVALNVWEFNQSAIAFYHSLGYATSSRMMEIPLRQPLR